MEEAMSRSVPQNPGEANPDVVVSAPCPVAPRSMSP
jgi:hypothetical protein